MTIYTIGHSTRPFPSLVRLLNAHGVELLADIRAFPGSRKHPQYGRDVLMDSMPENGIDYTLLGESLGGRRRQTLTLEQSPNAGLRHPSFRNFADHMLSPEFKEGVRVLLELGERRTVCLMCSEGWWVKCHRRLLADYLVANGIEVRHISSGIRADRHSVDPAAVVRDGGVTYPPVSEGAAPD